MILQAAAAQNDEDLLATCLAYFETGGTLNP